MAVNALRGKRRGGACWHIGLVWAVFLGIGIMERGGRLWWGKRQVKEKRKVLTGQIWRLPYLEDEWLERQLVKMQ